MTHTFTPRTCARCGRSFPAIGREYTCGPCKEPPNEHTERTPKLSFREEQIVRLVQEAKTNKEIAFTLCLSVGTVKEYVYHIFRKLGVTNRTELALWGRGYVGERKAS